MRSLSSIIEPRGIVPGPGYRFNYGSPPKTKSMPIIVTVLGNPETSIAWPRRLRVGLIFEKGATPLKVIEKLMRKEGFRSADELRQKFRLPKVALTCRDVGDETKGMVRVATADPTKVLRHALILGLCGPTFYDPRKVVIWTNNRLARRLELFEPEEWYADN